MIIRKNKTISDVKPILETDIASIENLHDKLKLLQFMQHDLEQLQKIKAIIEEQAEKMTDRHYDMLHKFSEPMKIINDHSTIEKLKITFNQYLKSLPDVKADLEYFKNRSKIGAIHSRIHVTPDWYLGSYMRLYEYLIPELLKKYGKHPGELADILMALHKVIILDMQIVMESYQNDNDYLVIDSVSSIMELILQINKTIEIKELAHAASDLSTNISANAEQLSASTQEAAVSAASMAERAEEIIDQSEKGKEIIQQALNSFFTMADEFTLTKNNIDGLLNEVSNITNIIQLIEGVAEQTNLLALNASIEAVRAGEHGRGFAVVANEVRKLAEQTKASVQKIRTTIESVENKTKYAGQMTEQMKMDLTDRVRQVKGAIEMLENITEKINEIGDLNNNIAAVSKEQSAATDDVALKINEIPDKIAQLENVVEETGRKIYEVSQHSDQLRRKIVSNLPHLRNKDFIRIVKTEHSLWKWWLHNYMLGYSDLDEKALTNHHECRLGKWYDEMKQNSAIRDIQSFQLLEKPHQQLHALANEIYYLIKENHMAEAKKQLVELENVSVEVINLLDELFEDLDD